MRRRLSACKKCGKDRSECECSLESAYYVQDRKGQRNALRKRQYDEEMLQAMNSIDDQLGLEREGIPVTPEMIQMWARERCKTRKNRHDFGGINALLRDFMEWAKDAPSTPCLMTFEMALRRGGFDVESGLVASLVLSKDLEVLKKL